nr:uncharacterized protein LOC109782579 [Aegilops tauschii subsp. strangulata]
MQKCLLAQLGRNIHVYFDDIVVKTKQHLTLLDVLKETFTNLREYQIKINPEKCVFGMPAGKLLGFLVSERGIEANLEKIKLMKKISSFEWNDQADQAFWDLKRMLSTTPILIAPAEKDPLLLYIAATSWSVSMVLVINRPEEGKIQAIQRPVYYLSEYFQEHVVIVVSTPPIGETIGCRDASGWLAKWAIELATQTILYEPRITIKSKALNDFLVDWMETQYLPPPPDSMHWPMHFDGSKMWSGLEAGIVLSSPKGDRLCYALQIHFAASNNVAEYEALVHGLWLAKEIGIRRILCYGDSNLAVQQASGECDARDANMASYRFLVEQLSGYFKSCEFLHMLHTKNEAANTLAKIGSSRQAIPSGASLEHLRKPSIRPSPNSESIFIPDGPAAPPPNPEDPGPVAGVAGSGSGDAEPVPGAVGSGSGTAESVPGVANLVPAATVSNPAAAIRNPGATEPGSGAAILNPIQVAIITMVAPPSWAQPILDFLESGDLRMDETQARQVQCRASTYTIINNELVRRSATGVF